MISHLHPEWQNKDSDSKAEKSEDHDSSSSGSLAEVSS